MRLLKFFVSTRTFGFKCMLIEILIFVLSSESVSMTEQTSDPTWEKSWN